MPGVTLAALKRQLEKTATQLELYRRHGLIIFINPHTLEKPVCYSRRRLPIDPHLVQEMLVKTEAWLRYIPKVLKSIEKRKPPARRRNRPAARRKTRRTR